MNNATQERFRNLSGVPRGQGCDIPLSLGWGVAVAVGVVYLAAASSGTFRFRPSPFPHHVLIADAWLHGQLNVREEVLRQRSEPFYQRQQALLSARYRAQGRQLNEHDWQRIRGTLKSPTLHDWAYVNGKYYGYWGPMPAVILLPYVAVAGVEASDRLVSCLLGTGTVLFTFLILREIARLGLVAVTPAASGALAILVGLGTIQFYLAVMGQVWFLSQVTAAFCLTVAIWAVLRTDRAWGWAVVAGSAFGAAFLSRNSVLITGPFFLFALRAVCPAGRPRWPWTMRRVLAFAIPLVAAGAGMLAYNEVRFRNPFEDGLGLTVVKGGNPRFVADYLQHGAFSLYYVPRNAYYYFLNPLLHRDPRTHAITFDPDGNSMFLVTPALLYVFRARCRNELIVGTWLGVGAGLTMLLCYFATGWYNFGNRYLLDVMPLAVLLVAAGMGGRLTRVSSLLIALSVAANAWGTYRFCALQLQ